MLIRCEKCSTLYELEDRLIPAGGAPVQCSKCQFVFRAYPPAPAGEGRGEGSPASPTTTSSPSPSSPSHPTPPPSPHPSAAPDAPPADPPRSSPALRAPASAPGPDAKFTPDGRPIRKVPFPDDESGGAPRSALGRGGAARGPSIPVKPRSGAPRWVLPAVLVVLLLAAAAAYAGWRVLSRRGRPQALAPARGAPAESVAVAPAPPPRGRAAATPGNGVAHPAPERPS
ncbi:MAG TPA: zinc-ribbon domain-containing protein [Anaeromyxobacteraceae bacterium]|nr:zinc-ribbon domain-containing protein [Anaeromyxobacteraceae bacterium]